MTSAEVMRSDGGVGVGRGAGVVGRGRRMSDDVQGGTDGGRGMGYDVRGRLIL